MLALVDVQAAKSIWTPLLPYIFEFLIIVPLKGESECFSTKMNIRL